MTAQMQQCAVLQVTAPTAVIDCWRCCWHFSYCASTTVVAVGVFRGRKLQQCTDAVSAALLCAVGVALNYRLQTKREAVNTEDLTTSFGWTSEDACKQRDVHELKKVSATVEQHSILLRRPVNGEGIYTHN
jgi:hypothetical protein